MPPNPRALEWLDKMNSLGAKDISLLSPAEGREEDKRTTLPFLTAPEPVERIENRRIRAGLSEIPVRIYWPKISEEEDEQDLYPIVVYFHGGGFVLGSLDLYDEICCMLSNRSEAIVVSVDYRLAPEHKFPMAVHDCYAATKWAFENAKLLEGDVDTIVVTGDSAGGTLVTSACLESREKNGPQIALQVSIYPITDLTRDLTKYSKDRFGPSKEIMDWYIKYYTKNSSDLRDPLASPGLADLRDLPPAVVVTAELDPLREQDLDFVEKLESSGVKVKLLDYPGMIHGSVSLPGYFGDGRDAVEKIGSEIKKVYVENVM